MGAIARSILTRFSPVFLLAAVTLATASAIDPDLDDLGWVVIAIGAWVSGTVCGAIDATNRHDIAVLGGALYEAISAPADDRAETP